MKSRIKDTIRHEFRTLVPSSLPKFNLQEINQSNRAQEVKTATKFHYQKRSFISLGIVVAMTSISFILLLNKPHGTPMSVSARIEEFSLPIVASAFLTSDLESGTLQNLRHNLNMNDTYMDDYIDLVNSYVNAFETSTISDNLNQHVETSDRTGYTKKIVMTSTNILNQEVDYTIYYEALTANSLRGLSVYQDLEIEFTGIISEEEEEQKLIIQSFYDSNESDNYIEMKITLEENETKYFISIYAQGSVIVHSEINHEITSSEKKTSVTLQQEEDTIQFIIKKEDEEDEFIKIDYLIHTSGEIENGSMVVNVVYHAPSYVYYYTYALESGNYTTTYQKIRK